MLSERGKGFKIALNSLNVGRIKLAAACLDASRRVTTESVKYANERQQFGTAIANFGAIRKKLAEMSTRTFAAEAACYRTGHDIQKRIAELLEGGASHEQSELEAFTEYAIECAILKVYASEVSQYVSDEGIQIFGGMGFSKDAPMESAWRDARITRIYEGTNEINRLLTVAMLLKKAMKGQLDLMTPAMAVGKSLMEIPSFEVPDFSEPLSEEKQMIGKLKKAFLMVAGKAVEKFGLELEQQQQLILCAAEIMIEIYLAESAVLKADKLIRKFPDKDSQAQQAMASLQLFHAVEIVNSYGKEAIAYMVEGDERRIMLMGLKRFTKYINHPDLIDLRKTVAEKVVAENSYCF
jgi:hypothetical protein